MTDKLTENILAFKSDPKTENEHELNVWIFFIWVSINGETNSLPDLVKKRVPVKSR